MSDSSRSVIKRLSDKKKVVTSLKLLHSQTKFSSTKKQDKFFWFKPIYQKNYAGKIVAECCYTSYSESEEIRNGLAYFPTKQSRTEVTDVPHCKIKFQNHFRCRERKRNYR